jgi:hypothetical protein
MHARRVTSSLWFVVSAISAMLVTLTACATPSSREATRHMRVVNATYDGVTALAFAPSGSTDFRQVALTQPLAGGLSSIIVDVPSGACLRDVRVTFRGERTLLYPNLDVCRNDGLRLAVGGARTGRATMLKDDIQAAGSP